MRLGPLLTLVLFVYKAVLPRGYVCSPFYVCSYAFDGVGAGGFEDGSILRKVWFFYVVLSRNLFLVHVIISVNKRIHCRLILSPMMTFHPRGKVPTTCTKI